MLGWLYAKKRDELSTTPCGCRNSDVASDTDKHYFELQVIILCYKNRGGRGGPGHLKILILTSQPIIHMHIHIEERQNISNLTTENLIRILNRNTVFPEPLATQ